MDSAGLGLSIPEVAGRTRSSADPATEALIARMSVGPGAVRAGVIDTLVRALKGAGIWAKLDLLYLLAAHDSQAARLNWVSSSYTLAAVNSPGFTTDRGYAGDGVTSYLSTGWAPFAGPQLVQDSAACGVWLNAGTVTGDDIARIGCSDGSGSRNLTLLPRDTSNRVLSRVNASAQTQLASLTSRLGMIAGNRSGASAVQLYRNGSSIGSGSEASTGAPTTAFYLCGQNLNGSFGRGLDNRHSAFFAGASLSSGEHAALYATLAAYMTAVGA